MSFLVKEGVIDYQGFAGFSSKVVESDRFISIRAIEAGFLDTLAKAGENVQKGQVLAYITDPYTSEILQTVTATEDAIVAFQYDSPIAYKNTALFKLIPGRW